MNTEDTLTDLFAHQAADRPEPAAVLEAVHRRIARRRRVTATRTASALGAAAGVAAIAVTVTVLNGSSGPHADPAGGPALSAPASSAPVAPPSSAPARPPSSAPATRAGGSSAPRASHVSPPRSSTPRIAGMSGGHYSTINAGWLPGPAKQNPDGTSNRPGFEERDWDVDVDGVSMDVIIWTESGSLPSRMQATGGTSDYRRVTVNGHRGREFVSSNITIVSFDLGNGTTAYVGPSVQHTTANVTTARITAIAEKVAANMQFNRHDPIPGR